MQQASLKEKKNDFNILKSCFETDEKKTEIELDPMGGEGEENATSA